MTPANRPPDAAIDPISVIMLDLEAKARAEMARRDAVEFALTWRAVRAEGALRRSQGWLAVFVWTTLLLVTWGIVALVLRYAPAIDAWRWK